MPGITAIRKALLVFEETHTFWKKPSEVWVNRADFRLHAKTIKQMPHWMGVVCKNSEKLTIYLRL